MDLIDKIIALFNEIREKIKQELKEREVKLQLVHDKERVSKSAQFYQMSYSEEFIYDEVAQNIEDSRDEHLESCAHWIEDLRDRGLIRVDVANDLHRQVSRRRRRLLLEKRPAPILPHVLKREEQARKRREIREIKGPTKIV